MPSQSEIREQVTRQIVAALESEILPWRRPWKSSGSQPGRHSNVASRKPYQGINPMLLEIHALRLGLMSRWWGTFGHWKSLGCNIRKRPKDVEEGHWGCHVVLYKPVTKTVLDERTGDEDEERFFVLKTFTVFSADQVEGAAAEQYQAVEQDGQTDALPDFQPAEDLIAATAADIRYGGNRAYYVRPLRRAHFQIIGRAILSSCRPRQPSPRQARSTRRPCMNWHTGRKFAPAGTTTRTATPWANWPPRSPPATSPPNWASRKARDSATMPPTCGAGWTPEGRPQLHLQGGQAGVQGHGLPAGLRQEART